MRKNNLIHLTVSAAIVLAASFSLSSCEDILGEWDRSTPELFPTIGKVTITQTATGASVTVNAPSDITNLLASVTSDIAAKGSSEYVFDITNGGVKSTGSDNTITVPKVSGSNINLVFEKGINTQSPLIIKASETASATPTTAVNKLTITMPAGTTSLNLVIDMPETSVTVKTTSGSVVYEGIVANTATNTLIIESGVTIKNLQVKGGIVVVKEGGKVETNVYAPESNDYVMYQYGDQEGVEPVWVDLKGDGNYVPNVQNEDGSAYLFKNLKVIKGAADYARIALYNGGKPLEKLTIAADAAVLFNQQSTCVKVIEGEGEGTAKVTLSGWAQNYSWMENEKEVYPLYCNLNVEKISGIIFTAPINTNSNVVESDNVIIRNQLNGVPTNIENCTFNFDQVSFATAKETTGSAKNCKFLSPKNNQQVYIQVPAQTAEISSYKFAFSSCNFGEGTMIYPDLEQRVYEYDSNGNPVFYNNPCYEYRMDGRWYVVESLDDVPKGATEVYTREYDIQKYTYAEFNNYDITVAFDGCKLADASINKESGCFGFPYVPSGVVFKYEIDGTSYSDYEWKWDEATQKSYCILK